MNLRVRVYLGSPGFHGEADTAGGTGDAQVQDDGAVGPDGDRGGLGGQGEEQFPLQARPRVRNVMVQRTRVRHERPEDGGLSGGTVPKVADRSWEEVATLGTFVDNLFTTRYNCKKRVFRGARGGRRRSYVNYKTVSFLFAPTCSGEACAAAPKVPNGFLAVERWLFHSIYNYFFRVKKKYIYKDSSRRGMIIMVVLKAT